MPETVLVTVEQLREWRKRIRLTLFQCSTTCAAKSGGICDCGNNAAWLSMEEALAQAERQKNWKPKVGDRVRLKAMPELGPFVVHSIDSTGIVELLRTGQVMRKFAWRYLAELMPEEG